MNELRILEEIRDEFVSKFENDPQVKRICNVMINEFKARKKALTLPVVSQQRELLENFADWMDKNVNFDGIRQEEIESYITEKIL